MKKLSKSVKKQLLNLLFVAVLIGITITVLLVNFKELNFDNIGAFFDTCNPYYIVAAFACMLLFVLFEALALFFIARNLGHKSKFHQSLAYSAADTYYSAITPSASGGQPASAFYMARDGMGAGKASFALVFNLIGYTAAVLVIGLVALILRPTMFFDIGPFFARFLVIFGLVMQVLLLGLFIACMFFGKAILKVGNWLIRVLTKIKIVKKPEKWQKKLEEEVEKFRSCRAEIKKHPRVVFEALIFNILQRTSQTFIPVFVCLAAKPDSSVIDLFVMQVLVLYGYNCVPLPGGVGAYEFLYLNIYCIHPGYDSTFILVAMMISRFIQYYICMGISGVYTLTYHMVGGKKKNQDTDDASDTESQTDKAEPATEPDASESGDDLGESALGSTDPPTDGGETDVACEEPLELTDTDSITDNCEDNVTQDDGAASVDAADEITDENECKRTTTTEVE